MGMTLFQSYVALHGQLDMVKTENKYILDPSETGSDAIIDVQNYNFLPTIEIQKLNHDFDFG